MNENGDAPSSPCFTRTGLTKREYFAGLAMQGLIPSTIEYGEGNRSQAVLAVTMADALLKELDKDE